MGNKIYFIYLNNSIIFYNAYRIFMSLSEGPSKFFLHDSRVHNVKKESQSNLWLKFSVKFEQVVRHQR